MDSIRFIRVALLLVLPIGVMAQAPTKIEDHIQHSSGTQDYDFSITNSTSETCVITGNVTVNSGDCTYVEDNKFTIGTPDGYGAVSCEIVADFECDSTPYTGVTVQLLVGVSPSSSTHKLKGIYNTLLSTVDFDHDIQGTAINETCGSWSWAASENASSTYLTALGEHTYKADYNTPPTTCSSDNGNVAQSNVNRTVVVVGTNIISSVNLTDIIAPVTDNQPTATAPDVSSLTDVSASAVTWKVTSSGTAISAPATFAATTEYTATIVLTASAGSQFSHPTAPTISITGCTGTATAAVTSVGATDNYNTLTVTCEYAATGKIQVVKPALAASPATYPYTGSNQTVTLNPMSSTYYTVSNTTQKDANTHTLTAALNDGSTAEWSDTHISTDYTFTWTIDPIDPIECPASPTTLESEGCYTKPTSLTATTGQTLVDVDIASYTDANGNWDWDVATSTTVGTTAGTPSFNAKFTPSSSNFNAKNSIPVTVTVSESPITTAAITVITPVVAVAPSATATAAGTVNFDVGSVTWDPTDNPFKGGTAYTATVTLTAHSGFTFEGLTLANATINGNAATSFTGTPGATAVLNYTFGNTDPATVNSIAVKTQPTNLVYDAGDNLDLTGIVVTLTYNDGTTRDVAFADFGTENITTNPANNTALALTDDNSTVEVIYNSSSIKTYTDPLTVNDPGAVLTPIATAAITVTTPVVAVAPNATANAVGTVDFNVGSVTWDPTDNPFKGSTAYKATVTLTAHSGFTFEGLALADATINGNAATSFTGTPGTTAVLNYTFGNTDPATVSSIAVKTPPTRTAYDVGDALALAGMVVTLTYNDGTTKDVALADFTTEKLTTVPTNGATLALTDVAVVVTYDNNASITANTPITVTDPGTPPTPIASVAILVTTPVTGGTPDLVAVDDNAPGNFTLGNVTWIPTITGGKFLGSTPYKAEVVLTVSGNYTFPAAATATINGNTADVTGSGSSITVSYEFGATATKTVSSIAITTPPTKTAYDVGDALALDGMVVTLTYNDGTTEPVILANFGTNKLTTNPADGVTLALANTSVVVTYDNNASITANTPITVTDPGTPTTPITNVAITVTEPVIGVTSATSITNTPVNYSASVTWDPTVGAIGSNTVTVILTAETGYTFTGLTAANATINGQEATIVGTPGATVTLEYTFTLSPTGTFAITGTLPGGTYDVVYNPLATALGTEFGTGTITWSALPANAPPGLNINATTGVVSGTPSAAGSYTFDVSATDATPTTATQSFTVVIAQATGTFPAHSTIELPYTVGITLNDAVSQLLPNYAFTDALTTPLTEGTETDFDATYTDPSGNYTQATGTITVKVLEEGAIVISTPELPDGVYGTPYTTTTLSATGGDGNYTWTVTGLPDGLSYNSSTGVISGTPTETNTFTVTVKVEDGGTPAIEKEKTFEITIAPATPVVTLPTLEGYEGSELSTVTLPTGWEWVDDTEIIADDGSGFGEYCAYTSTDHINYEPVCINVKVNPQPAELIIITDMLPNGTYDSIYSELVLATGGIEPYEWSIATGVLPNGLAMSLAGTISGTPTETGSFPITIKVEDSSSPKKNKTKEFTIVIDKGTDPDYQEPEDSNLGDGTEGKTIASVTLPRGWEWADSLIVIHDTIVQYEAIYIPSDTTIYRIIHYYYTINVVEGAKVIRIAVKSQPDSLVYDHGDLLDLTGLAVTLTYSDSTTEDVPFEHFDTRITATPPNGTALTVSTHNGKPVEVLYVASALKVNTNPLTVNKIEITLADISITTPVKGNAPTTSAVIAATDNFTAGTIAWDPVADAFAANVEYSATVTLTVKEGYVFSEVTRAKINGNNADVISNNGTLLKLTYTFPKTAADIIFMVGGKAVEPVNDKFIFNAACRENYASINISQENANIDIKNNSGNCTHFGDDNVSCNPALQYGNNEIPFAVTSSGGIKNYTAVINKPIPPEQLVKMRWGNTLTVIDTVTYIDNQRQEHGSYKWYRNGEEVATGRSFSAGVNGEQLSGKYYVEITTKNSANTLRSCDTTYSVANLEYGILLKHNLKNSVGIEVILPESSDVELSIYDIKGNLVYKPRENFGKGDMIYWNLTDNLQRKISNGLYFVVAKAKGESGKNYRYSKKLAVKR